MDPLLTETLLQVIYDGAEYEDSSHLKLIYESFQKIEQDNNYRAIKKEKGAPPGLEQLTRIKNMKQHFTWIPVPAEMHKRRSLFLFIKSSRVVK